jgi:hypothetical protein
MLSSVKRHRFPILTPAASAALQCVEFDRQLYRCFERREQFDHQGAPSYQIFSVSLSNAAILINPGESRSKPLKRSNDVEKVL